MVLGLVRMCQYILPSNQEWHNRRVLIVQIRDSDMKSLFGADGPSKMALTAIVTIAVLVGACSAEETGPSQAAQAVELPEGVPAEAFIQADGPVALSEIDLPEGFSIHEWAEVDGARSMVVGDNFVVVGTQGDAVYLVPFDATMKAAETQLIADGMNVPNGVALVEGVLYIAEQSRLVRWGDAPFDPANPDQTPVKIGPDLPDLAHHGWRYMATTPDNQLLIALGSPCNICTPEGMQGSLIKVDPQTGDHAVVATGIRNSVGVAFNPTTGVPFFTDNGADMMGDDSPPGEMNALIDEGSSYGFPWYGGGHDRTPDFAEANVPENAVFPVMDLQPHAASLGFIFYQGEMFPPTYKGSIIVAQHGSWNRTFPVGYNLMHLGTDAEGMPVSKQDFATGWLDKGDVTGRPVDVKELPDGSILVSDDMNGLIYRITYSAP
jgi:glucose/arabinose dehydrogenase